MNLIGFDQNYSITLMKLSHDYDLIIEGMFRARTKNDSNRLGVFYALGMLGTLDLFI